MTPTLMLPRAPRPAAAQAKPSLIRVRRVFAAAVVCGLAALVALPSPSSASEGEKGAATTPQKGDQPPAAGQGAPKPASPATLRFINPGPGVTIKVNDGPWQPLRRGATLALKVDVEEVHYLVARGDEWQYEAHVSLRHVRDRTIELVPPGGYVRVVNRSGEPRMLVWAGSALGALKRGSSRLLGPLVTGTHALLATGVRSRDVFALRVTLKHGGRSTVVLPPVPAGLVVPNPLREPAHVIVNHQSYGDVAPGAKVTVLGLPPGDHKVQLVGRRSGRPWRYGAQLGTRGAAPPKPGALNIHVRNDTGEPLELASALEGLHEGPIAPDAKVVLQVPRKTFRIAARGGKSGLPYHFDVRPKNGGEQRWAPTRPMGHLHLTNATGEAASLDIDGVATVQLRAGQKLTVRKVPAGLIQLKVKTEVSGKTFAKGVQLPPNGDVAWKVSAGGTSLIVQNRYREQVTLVIDGAPRGDVGPESIFRVHGIAAGDHTIEARTRWSKRTELATVRLVDGEKTRFVLAPPMATVRVTNPLDEPLDVVIRGVGAGSVKVGETRAFSTDSGRLVVAVHAVKSGRSANWSGTLAPGQHLPMPTPDQGGSTLVVTNPLKVALTVQVDRQEPLQVAPGATVEVRDLTQGKHLVTLKTATFEQRQRVTVVRGQPKIQVKPLTD